jgi:hypothetical protein
MVSSHFSVAISQGNDVHQHRYARSVGPLYQDFLITSLDSILEHLRHLRFVVGHKRAVGSIEAPRTAIALRRIPRPRLASP